MKKLVILSLAAVIMSVGLSTANADAAKPPPVKISAVWAKESPVKNRYIGYAKCTATKKTAMNIKATAWLQKASKKNSDVWIDIPKPVKYDGPRYIVSPQSLYARIYWKPTKATRGYWVRLMARCTYNVVDDKYGPYIDRPSKPVWIPKK